MKSAKRIISISLILWIVGCTQSAFQPQPASDRPDSAPPPPSSSVVFGKDGSPLPGPYLRGAPDDGEAYPSPQWDITRTFRSGRTIIRGTRQDGNTTEQFTSTDGPNGRTVRRRVDSTSTPSRRHFRP